MLRPYERTSKRVRPMIETRLTRNWVGLAHSIKYLDLPDVEYNIPVPRVTGPTLIIHIIPLSVDVEC